jgi:hypothetical protein
MGIRAFAERPKVIYLWRYQDMILPNGFLQQPPACNFLLMNTDRIWAREQPEGFCRCE